MRQINGISGVAKGEGVKEIETNDMVSVRIIDGDDGRVALRIGTHLYSARLEPEQARHIAALLVEAASRVEK